MVALESGQGLGLVLHKEATLFRLSTFIFHPKYSTAFLSISPVRISGFFPLWLQVHTFRPAVLILKLPPSSWLRLSHVLTLSAWEEEPTLLSNSRVCSQDLGQMLLVVFIFSPVLNVFSVGSLSPDLLILNISSWWPFQVPYFLSMPQNKTTLTKFPAGVTTSTLTQGGRGALHNIGQVSFLIGLVQSSVCLFLGSPGSYFWLSNLLLRAHSASFVKIQPRELSL